MEQIYKDCMAPWLEITFKKNAKESVSLGGDFLGQKRPITIARSSS
jgi:hypothetical protein